MKYAVLDLETTGTGADDDMIQVGLVVLDEQFNVAHTFNSFVKPSGPIPAFITQLTGIDDSMVADAPEPDELLLQLIPLLDDAVLIAHNVAFDAGFLNRALNITVIHHLQEENWIRWSCSACFILHLALTSLELYRSILVFDMTSIIERIAMRWLQRYFLRNV